MSKINSKLVKLDKGKILKPNCNSATINCIKGILWITFKGSKDIILEQGTKVKLVNKKSILIEAIDKCEIELSN